MKFQIKEYHQKIKFKNRFFEFIANWTIIPMMGLLLLVVLPFIVLYNFLFNKNQEKEKFDFEILFKSDNLIIERKPIDENDLPEYLDYEEDSDIYLFVYKSNPNLALFENRFFNYIFHETEFGIYTVSYNEIGEGMSLWYIDKSTLEFQKVKNLISSFWECKSEDNKVILSTKTNNEEIKIEINQFIENKKSDI